ncbi:MAG: TolB protein [Mariprofundaceae bacterium]
MKKIIGLSLMLVLAAPAAHAEGFLDWLESHSGKSGSSAAKVEKPADDALLLTLEPGESEMYPKVSPDGKALLVVSGKKKNLAVTRRLLENGDPVNVVSDDNRALDSLAWHGNDRVTFLSTRAGGLGLWDKAVDGHGVLHRLQRLNGQLLQPVALADGSIIAVRLFSATGRKQAASGKRDAFVNWEFPKLQPHIVRIGSDGVETDLSAGVNPAVSPDGSRVVFSMQAGRSRHLFMMRTDGSELVQLTDERSIDVQPAWSPDGQWIVFTSNRGKADMRHPGKSNWDIWAVDVQGRNISQLTMDKARDGAPNVGSDGRVYFHSDRKVSKAERARHQVKGSSAGFHIWSVTLPHSS